MAFSTAVNNQIIDAAENGQSLLPARILQLSHAFTQTLEMENAVYQNQINGIINMVLYALQKVGEITGDTTAAETAKTKLQEMADSLKAKIAGSVTTAGSEAAAALPPGNVNEQTLEAAVTQSLSLSFQNAVNAQQQMYVTMQAATTMAISTLFNIDTAADENHTNHTL